MFGNLDLTKFLKKEDKDNEPQPQQAQEGQQLQPNRQQQAAKQVQQSPQVQQVQQVQQAQQAQQAQQVQSAFSGQPDRQPQEPQEFKEPEIQGQVENLGGGAGTVVQSQPAVLQGSYGTGQEPAALGRNEEAKTAEPVEPNLEPTFEPSQPSQRNEPESQQRQEEQQEEIKESPQRPSELTSRPKPKVSIRAEEVEALVKRAAQVLQDKASYEKARRLAALLESRIAEAFSNHLSDIKNYEGNPLEKLILERRITPEEVFSILKRLHNEIFGQEPSPFVFLESGEYVEYSRTEKGVIYRVGGQEVEVNFYPSLTDKPTVVVPYNVLQVLKGIASVGEEFISIGQELVEKLILQALSAGSSDIHIIPERVGDDRYVFRVYLRVNQMGQLLKQYFEPATWEQVRRAMEVAVAESGNTIRVDELDVIKEGGFEVAKYGVRVRYEYIPDWTRRQGEIVLRLIVHNKEKLKLMKAELESHRPDLIPPSDKPQSEIKKQVKERLLSLNYDEKTVNFLLRVIEKRNTLFVITGRTNSGKSTLVRELLEVIPPHEKLYTIEDPVEGFIKKPFTVQHQIFTPKAQEKRLGFLEYVKAAKRADTNVIFVGEWRKDNALTEAIIEAAQAGQLVITTLHINRAFAIYHALSTMYGIEIGKVINTIGMVFHQALIPRLCPHCRQRIEEKPFSDEELAIFSSLTQGEKTALKGLVGYYRRNEKGCPYCNSGIVGVVPVYEYFVPNQALLSYDGEHLPPAAVRELLEKGGTYTSIVDRFIYLLKKGEVEPQSLNTLIN